MDSAETLRHQLGAERHRRAAAETDADSLRRENARLRSAYCSRTHYVIFVPKPKWAVWRNVAILWLNRGARWAAAAIQALRDILWPPADDPKD